MFLFEVLFYQPIYNLLMFFYSLTGNNLGLAIIIIALIVKIITIPLTKKQMESGKKMKVFQEKTKQVKEKFKKNKEKMNEEMMKLTSQYMPAQLSGCLPLIVSIIFLIQVRNVVVNLVNQGYESFNEVAYVESLKFDVDSAKFQPEEELKEGEHQLQLIVEGSNGKTYEETITFFRVTDENEGKQKSKEFENSKTKEEKTKDEEIAKNNRESDIAVHIENFDKGKFVIDSKPEFNIFFRPPSNETIDDIEIELSGEKVEENLELTKGETLNLNFLGMDLSKVGTDFIGNWKAFTPYLILCIFIGVTQFVTTKLQMGLNPDLKKKTEKKPEKKSDKKNLKGTDGKASEPDFSEIMQQSSQQMIYMMPIMTAGISLGFLGGATFFPTAVSLFWTANNLFVIIQQVFNSRKELKKMLKERRWIKSEIEISSEEKIKQ